jgi:lysophospholipase L1-like esterase
MKTAARLLFYLGALLLWAALAGLTVETYEAIRWRRIETRNPLVQALGGQSPWSDSAAGALPESVEPPLPEPDPRDVYSRRAAFFLSLSPEDRPFFVNNYCIDAILLNSDGKPVSRYTYRLIWDNSKPLDDVYGGEAATAIREVATAARLEDAGVLRPYSDGKPGGVGGEVFGFPAPPGGPQDVAALVFVKDTEGHARCAQPDDLWEHLFFAYKPHVQLPDRELHTNNYGFRDAEVPMPKPAGVYRIVCLGGSTTEEGPTVDLTYPNLLERELNQRCGAGPFDVINAGIPGAQAIHAKMRLPDYMALAPDLLLVYIGANDLTHFHLRRWVEAAQPWQKLLRCSRFIRRHGHGWLLPSLVEQEADLRDTTLKRLAFIAEYGRAHGVAVVLCSFAGPRVEALTRQERDYYEFVNARYWGGEYVDIAAYCRLLVRFNRKLEAMCRDQGILYVPVAEEFKGGADCFSDICHMRNKGIEQKAAIIFRHLVELDPVRACCTSAEPVSAP